MGDNSPKFYLVLSSPGLSFIRCSNLPLRHWSNNKVEIETKIIAISHFVMIREKLAVKFFMPSTLTLSTGSLLSKSPLQLSKRYPKAGIASTTTSSPGGKARKVYSLVCAILPILTRPLLGGLTFTLTANDGVHQTASTGTTEQNIGIAIDAAKIVVNQGHRNLVNMDFICFFILFTSYEEYLRMIIIILVS